MSLRAPPLQSGGADACLAGSSSEVLAQVASLSSPPKGPAAMRRNVRLGSFSRFTDGDTVHSPHVAQLGLEPTLSANSLGKLLPGVRDEEGQVGGGMPGRRAASEAVGEGAPREQSLTL